MRIAKTVVFKVDTSWRYVVLGVYKDREYPLVRLYPVPFVRITVGKLNGRLVNDRSN